MYRAVIIYHDGVIKVVEKTARGGRSPQTHDTRPSQASHVALTKIHGFVTTVSPTACLRLLRLPGRSLSATNGVPEARTCSPVCVRRSAEGAFRAELNSPAPRDVLINDGSTCNPI